MPLADGVEQREAVHAGQLHVAQDQGRTLHREMGERSFGGGHGSDVIPGRIQPHRQQLEQVGVVVDDQQARAGHLEAPLAGALAAGGWAGEAGRGATRLRSMAFSASSFWLA